MYVLSPAAYPPPCQRQRRFGPGSKGYGDARWQVIDKISELAVYGRFSDKMKIVQYQGPGAGIPCQGVD